MKQDNAGFCLPRVHNDPGLTISSVKSPIVILLLIFLFWWLNASNITHLEGKKASFCTYNILLLESQQMFFFFFRRLDLKHESFLQFDVNHLMLQIVIVFGQLASNRVWFSHQSQFFHTFGAWQELILDFVCKPH